MANNQSCRIPPKPEGYKEQWTAYGVLSTSKQQRDALFHEHAYSVFFSPATFESTPIPPCIDCAICSVPLKKDQFHADHIQELWLINREAYPECLRFWSISNLQAICLPCHKAKTIQNTKARAKCKRIISRANGTRRARKSIANRPFPKLTEAQKKIQRERQKAFRKLITKKSTNPTRDMQGAARR